MMTLAVPFVVIVAVPVTVLLPLVGGPHTTLMPVTVVFGVILDGVGVGVGFLVLVTVGVGLGVADLVGLVVGAVVRWPPPSFVRLPPPLAPPGSTQALR